MLFVCQGCIRYRRSPSACPIDKLSDLRSKNLWQSQDLLFLRWILPHQNFSHQRIVSSSAWRWVWYDKCLQMLASDSCSWFWRRTYGWSEEKWKGEHLRDYEMRAIVHQHIKSLPCHDLQLLLKPTIQRLRDCSSGCLIVWQDASLRSRTIGKFCLCTGPRLRSQPNVCKILGGFREVQRAAGLLGIWSSKYGDSVIFQNQDCNCGVLCVERCYINTFCRRIVEYGTYVVYLYQYNMID